MVLIWFASWLLCSQHDDQATAAVIRDHKQTMLRDMVGLIGHRVWREDGDKRGARKGSKEACSSVDGISDTLDGSMDCTRAGNCERNTNGFVLLNTR